MLAVERLSKSFGGLRAVDGCSFEVQEGTITGLIGPNGAGKTTLFNLLTGFLRPDSGRATLEGQDITGLAPHHVFRRGVSRTFQIPRELGGMTVVENLMLVPTHQMGERMWNPLVRPRGVRRQEKEVRRLALEVLEFLDLRDLANDLAVTLSGGQKKLLELARTMMTNPRLILLDEPGAGVNRTLLKRLASAIRILCTEREMTFLLIEHDMDFVMRLCTPVIVMSEGRVLMAGDPAEVQRDPRVLDAYLGGQYVATDG
ncbi:MAG: ABC transporter ATP-binding protein [Candidatus Bipolaricaulota bacterium]|nr:MAG: ABC transporter ATP-binding protein [Candidatus Bipolaricaulota bacterium]